MAQLNDVFTPTTVNGASGFIAALVVNLQTEENRLAQISGSGPGVPDANGNIVPGTIRAGHILTYGPNGTVILGTSPDLSTSFSKLFFVAISNTVGPSGAASSIVTCAHGGIRFDTSIYNPAGVYTVGAPLIAVNGVLEPKVLGDNKQVVGYVGPRGLQSGVLDVLFPQSGGGRY
jgi:hypothetical protein